MDKLISNYFRKIDESRAALDKSLDESHAARLQSQDEVSAQVDEMHESIDEIHEDMDEIHESFDEIGKSLDRMNESMDRTIEFKRLISEYLDNKIKRTEARENFCESQFWDEKNIH
jgi:methyl-accepting chemotaxis protein